MSMLAKAKPVLLMATKPAVSLLDPPVFVARGNHKTHRISP
jgi:hypothetical protein